MIGDVCQLAAGLLLMIVPAAASRHGLFDGHRKHARPRRQS